LLCRAIKQHQNILIDFSRASSDNRGMMDFRAGSFDSQMARMWHDLTDYARPRVGEISRLPEIRKTLGPIDYREPNVCSFTVTKDCLPDAVFLTVMKRHNCLHVERSIFPDVDVANGWRETEEIDFINVNGDLRFRTRDGEVMNLDETFGYLILPIVRAA
jgi:hypothetical protein